MPLLRPHGERYSTTFNLYREDESLWGRVRLAELGPSLVLQVQIDGDPNGWQDFQMYNVIQNRLHYGIVPRKPTK